MLSLVIPVYNMEHLLDRCMDTLLGQVCQDFEILLVDDGSTDASGALCDGYAMKHPDMIRVLHKPNGGLSSARNAGIQAASGEFVIFPDPDDWVEPDYVWHLVELQRKHCADMVCTGYFVSMDDREFSGSADAAPRVMSGADAQRALLLPPRMNGFAWNKLYRLSIIREHKLQFLDDVGITEDLDFAYRYLAHAQTVCHAPGLRTYHYYQRPNAATHSAFSVRKLGSLRTYEKIINDCRSRSPELAEAARDMLCVTGVNMLWDWYCGDRRDGASRAQLLGCIRKHLRSHLRSRHYGIGRKLQAAAAAAWPAGFAMLKGRIRKNGTEKQA